MLVALLTSHDAKQGYKRPAHFYSATETRLLVDARVID
jgi:hypothetical protein